MSEPTRFTAVTFADDGEFVRYDDFAVLRAQRDEAIRQRDAVVQAVRAFFAECEKIPASQTCGVEMAVALGKLYAALPRTPETP